MDEAMKEPPSIKHINSLPLFGGVCKPALPNLPKNAIIDHGNSGFNSFHERQAKKQGEITMEYTTLGKTGLRVSRMGFGGIPIQKV
ncbi:MAG: hypothetical protein ACLUI3_17135, partial [Christensenellales bacterium]